MSRLITAGGESGHYLTEAATLVGSAPTIEQAQAFSPGGWSFKFPNGSTQMGLSWPITGVVGRSYFFRLRFRISALGTQTVQLFRFGNSVSAQLLNTNGFLQFYNSGGQGFGTGIAIAVNTWYTIEGKVIVGTTTTNGTIVLTLYGGAFGDTTTAGTNALNQNGTANTGTAAPTQMQIGRYTAPTAAAGNDIWIDDVAVNDDQGTDQNSYCGADGRIIQLSPVSDNIAPVGWTTDTGGTVNMYQGLNSRPPIGIANATNSATIHQITNGVSNAAGRTQVKMTDYTTAGVPAGATIKLLRSQVAVSSASTSAPPAGAFGSASNPAEASNTFASYSNGTTNASTFPTGWKLVQGNYIYSPSVTLGTQPIFNVDKTTATTRIAIASHAAMVVEYTPAPAAKSLVIPHRNQRNTLVRM